MSGKKMHTVGEMDQHLLARNTIHLRVTQFTKKVKTTILEHLVHLMAQNGWTESGSKKTKRESSISLETLQMQNQMKEVEIGLSQPGAQSTLSKLNMLIIFKLLIVQFTMMTSVLSLS